MSLSETNNLGIFHSLEPQINPTYTHPHTPTHPHKERLIQGDETCFTENVALFVN